MRLRYSILLLCAMIAATTGCGADKEVAHKHGEHGGDASGEKHVGKSGEHSDARAVHLSPKQAAQLSIAVEQAEAGTADARFSAPASIAFDPDRTARVGPRLAAKVVKIRVDLGDRVEKGQPLALMDSVKLGQARAGYLTARARLKAAEADWKREKRLAKDNISSEAERLDARADFHQARAEYRAAEETLKLYGLSQQAIEGTGSGKAPLSRFTLSAPAAGVVQRRDLAPGQPLSADETPIHIVDTRKMWLMIDAYEKALPGLAVGQAVTFRTRGLPERRFEGRIDWISRELDAQSRTLRVRAELRNPEGLLRAGMSGTAHIQTDSDLRFALVSVDALQRVDGQDVVFVPGHEKGAYKAVPVSLGKEGDGVVEIREGLQPGDRVVVRGAFDLMSALTASGRSAAHSH